jgi:maltose alpha-D-glucosyltransferase/alpha-amylase
MQWDASPNAGFSEIDGRTYLPVIDDPVYGYQEVNVAAQEDDPGSLLSFTRRLVALRKRHPCFGRGILELVDTGNHAVLAYRRQYLAEDVLVLHNFSNQAQTVLVTHGGIDLVSSESYPAGQLTLAPYGYLWLRQ